MARIGKRDFALDDELDPSGFLATSSPNAQRPQALSNDFEWQSAERSSPTALAKGKRAISLAPIYLTLTATAAPSRAPPSPARVKPPVTPAGTITGIPLDRNSLMKQIRQYEDDYDSSYQVTRAEMRGKMAEQRREGCDRKLMAAEDYIGTLEGARRLKLYENRLLMEHEDDVSRQLRQYIKDMELKRERELKRKAMEEKVRMEREREEADRKRRQEDAEERRRKLLVEKRRQEQERKEAEERARHERLQKEALEAEMARLEKLRREEEARIEAERRREEEERRRAEEEAARRKRELDAELEKWQAWERSQEESEQEELSRRRQELAAQQEARRRKIEELRRQQTEAKGDAEAAQQESDKLKKQARIEQRARQIAETVGKKGLKPGAIVVDLNKLTTTVAATAVASPPSTKTTVPGATKVSPTPTSPVESEQDVVTDQQLDAELQKVSTLTLDEVRNEQHKYMKEKRALNIARRTWFESFKDREGRPPTDEEARAEMEDIDAKLIKLDEIVAALQKRSMLLAKSAWTTEEQTDAQKEEAVKVAQLKEKTDAFVKEAKGIVESFINHGTPVQSLRTLKEVERERNKCTKAKRKLKLQVKEWSDFFSTLRGRLPTPEDRQVMAPVVDALLQIEKLSEALDKRKAWVEAGCPPESPQTSDSAPMFSQRPPPGSGSGGGVGGDSGVKPTPEVIVMTPPLVSAQAKDANDAPLLRRRPSVKQAVVVSSQQQDVGSTSGGVAPVVVAKQKEAFVAVESEQPIESSAPRPTATTHRITGDSITVGARKAVPPKEKEADRKPGVVEVSVGQSSMAFATTVERRPSHKHGSDQGASELVAQGVKATLQEKPLARRPSQATGLSDGGALVRRPSVKDKDALGVKADGMHTPVPVRQESSRGLLRVGEQGLVRGESQKGQMVAEARDADGLRPPRRPTRSVQPQDTPTAEAPPQVKAEAVAKDIGPWHEEGKAVEQEGKPPSKKKPMSPSRGREHAPLPRRPSLRPSASGSQKHLPPDPDTLPAFLRDGPQRKPTLTRIDLQPQGVKAMEEGVDSKEKKKPELVEGFEAQKPTDGGATRPPRRVSASTSASVGSKPTQVLPVVILGEQQQQQALADTAHGNDRTVVRQGSQGLQGVDAVRDATDHAPLLRGPSVKSVQSISEASLTKPPTESVSETPEGDADKAKPRKVPPMPKGPLEHVRPQPPPVKSDVKGIQSTQAAAPTEEGKKDELASQPHDLQTHATGLVAVDVDKLPPTADVPSHTELTALTIAPSDALHAPAAQSLSLSRPAAPEGSQGEGVMVVKTEGAIAVAKEGVDVVVVGVPRPADARPVTALETINEEFERILDEAEEEKEDELTAAAEKTFDPETDIPGWNQCMYSDLASSAHAAAFYGCYEVLEYLCEQFDVFIMDNTGRTPLFYTAVSDELACCALLVSIGSDWINVGDERGDTPLHAACCNDSLKVMEFLLQSEASPNIANAQGLTPAHLAMSPLALELLHDTGGELHCIDSSNHMPLFTACLQGLADSVAFLVKHMERQWIGYADEKGDTPLHAAAQNGHGDCVGHICGAAWEWSVLNAANHKGYTPAHVASSVSVLQELYEYGADLFLTTNTNRTPLFTAAAKGLTRNVEFLLTLCDAAHPDAADTPDANGDTPMHAAACNGHETCVELLLRYAKFPTAKNCQNLTPADLARENGFQKISRMIEVHLKLMGTRVQAVGGQLSYEVIQQVRKAYGSRWTKQVDGTTGVPYYYDRATGLSQWERPVDFDESEAAAGGALSANRIPESPAFSTEGMTMERAKVLLQEFYRKVNPRKLADVEAILEERKNEFATLFNDLQTKYGVRFTEIEKKRDDARAALTKFYEQHNAKRLGDVDRILDEHSPDYDKLFQQLEAKYHVKIAPLSTG